MSHLHHGDEVIVRPFRTTQGSRSPQHAVPVSIARALAALSALGCVASLSRSSRDVLAYLIRLADLRDAQQPIFAFKRTIAAKTGLSESSVYRALNELAEENIVIREPQQRKARNGRLGGSTIRLGEHLCRELGLQPSSEPLQKHEQGRQAIVSEIKTEFGRGGEGEDLEKRPPPSFKMTDGQCITGFKALKAFQSLKKHSPGPQRAKASSPNTPRTTVPEELRWLISEKELRPSQVFLLMREYSQEKRRLSDAVACTEARLKALSSREIFAYLRALSKAPTDFAWIAKQKNIAVKAKADVEQVRTSRETLLTELDGQYLVNDAGAIHRVEVQVQSAEVWWLEGRSGRVRNGYVPINDGFVKAILDGRLKRIDSEQARATIENGFAAHVVH